MIEKVNISAKGALISKYWNPAIVGSVNNHHVKLAKFKGEFIWHKHDDEDEMFLVISGTLIMHLRDKTMTVNEGEFIIIPKGVEHKPASPDEALILLIEPATIVNTGDQTNSERTIKDLKQI